MGPKVDSKISFCSGSVRVRVQSLDHQLRYMTRSRSSEKVQIVTRRIRIVIQPEVKKMPSHGYFHVLTNHIKMGDE